MSYYDDTVASYESQLNNNYIKIDECNSKIRQLEDDISDLRQLRIRVVKVEEAVEKATNNTSNKIINLPSAVTNPMSFLKMNYFSPFLDVLKGSELTKAQSSVSSACSKIDAKIHELETEIQSLQNEISNCNEMIVYLNQQRMSYVDNMEKKIAQEAAANNASATTNAAASSNPNINNLTDAVKNIFDIMK